jgi:DNA-binding transcriptional regulator PaaX
VVFFDRYPVSLNALLVAPVIYRANLPLLRNEPQVTAAGMTDLARLGGFNAGAIRTALSRMRAAGEVEAFEDARGVTRYRMSALHRSVSSSVRGRPDRPAGFLLAVFSFATENARERQVVRDVLKLHGFQKLAQNVYLNGQIDTGEVERVVRENGLSEHLFLFRCAEDSDPAQDQRLMAFFDLKGRAAVLTRFERDLQTFLEGKGVSGDERARRLLAVGPVHFQITHAEEPPVPARCLPRNYPLDRVAGMLERAADRHAKELLAYYRRINA